MNLQTSYSELYNMHLQSISFGYADYKFIDALKQNQDSLEKEDIEITSKNICV